METFIGAVLYEFVNRNGPFNLFSASCFVGIIITIIIYKKFGKFSRTSELNTDLMSEEQSIQPHAITSSSAYEEEV